MTVLELLLDHLPERYVDRIVSYVSNRSELEREADNISVEMLTLFQWEDSREGYDFWSDLLEAIEEGKEIPKLPIDISYAPNTHLILEDNEWVVMNTGGVNINIRFDYTPSKVSQLKDKEKYEKFSAFVN